MLRIALLKLNIAAKKVELPLQNGLKQQNMENGQNDAPTALPNKKELKKQLADKMETALPELKEILGEKKFANRINKAAKLLMEGLHKEVVGKKIKQPVTKASTSGKATAKKETPEKSTTKKAKEKTKKVAAKKATAKKPVVKAAKKYAAAKTKAGKKSSAGK